MNSQNQVDSERKWTRGRWLTYLQMGPMICAVAGPDKLRYRVYAESGMVSQEEQAANTRLIASAPSLYAALHALETQYGASGSMSKMINADFEEWFDNGLLFLRGDPALTDLPLGPNSHPADFLKSWDALSPNCRSFIGATI